MLVSKYFYSKHGGICMKILILGGTGAIGNHVVELLSLENNDVYVTSRSENVSGGRVIYIKGNAHDSSFLNDIFTKNRFDVIVDFMSYGTEEFRQQMVLMLNSTEQYMFLSSSRVYADTQSSVIENSRRLLDTCIDEDYLKTDEYALTKARQENILINSEYRNWTIIRPYITYSNIRLQLGIYEKEQWLFRALMGKPIVFSDDIATKRTTLTYGGDVASIMIKLIGNKKAYGEIFHIASFQSVLWEDILKLYINVIEKKTGIRPEVYKIGNAIIPNASEFQYKYDRLFNRTFDSTKVLNIIGEDYEFMEIEEGLTKCLEEFIDNNLTFKAISWKGEALLDRASRCRTKIKDFTKYRDWMIYFIYRYIPFLTGIKKKAIGDERRCGTTT